MNKKLFQNKLIVKKSSLHGYGVFAAKTIRKGELIEECYLLITKGKDKVLEDYYFDARGKDAVLTGYGMIYNHADEPNADYKLSITKKVATFKAEKTIPKGSEIFISYGDEWFETRNKKPKHLKK